MSCPIYPSLPVDFLTLRYHRLVICKPQCLDPSSSDLYPLLQILDRFAYKLFYIDVKYSSGESGHPCLTPLPTFLGSEYSPPSLFLLAFSAPCTGFLLVFCLSNLFPSVSVHVVAFSIRPYQMLFHNPQSRYIHPDHYVCSSLLVLLMFLLHP